MAKSVGRVHPPSTIVFSPQNRILADNFILNSNKNYRTIWPNEQNLKLRLGALNALEMV